MIRNRMLINIIGILLCTAAWSVETGYIQVKCGSDVRVYLDDEIREITTERSDLVIIDNVEPGEHVLKLEKDGFQPHVVPINVLPGDILIYEIDEFTPIFEVYGEGRPEHRVMEQKTGNLEVRTVPYDCTIEIRSLGVNAENYGSKTTDLWGMEDVAVGSYFMRIQHEARELTYEFEIIEGVTTRIFADVINSEIYDVTNSDWPSETEESDSEPDPETTVPISEDQPEIPADSLHIQWALVPGGEFIMGCGFWSEDCGSDEDPLHKVILPEFFISTTEITNSQFCIFLNDYFSLTIIGDKTRRQKLVSPHKWGIQYHSGNWIPAKGYEQHPVVSVTWFGAQEFCRWASSRLETEIRLPTEAEWEYAARSGGQPENWAGMTKEERQPNHISWNMTNSSLRTHRVASRLPNGLGIYDMSGNVAEWVSDWYKSTYYKKAPVDSPKGAKSGKYKVFRGGTYYQDPWHLRCGKRARTEPSRALSDIGFRVVRPLQASQTESGTDAAETN